MWKGASALELPDKGLFISEMGPLAVCVCGGGGGGGGAGVGEVEILVPSFIGGQNSLPYLRLAA